MRRFFIVIASNTAPVTEGINSENGLLVVFFRPLECKKVIDVLKIRKKFAFMRQNVRKTVTSNDAIQQSLQQY